MRLLIVTTVNNMMRDFLLPFARHYRALGWTVDGMARRDDTYHACAAAFDHMWEIGWSRNPLELSNLVGNVRTVRATVCREGYDLVHVHTPIAAFLTRFALRDLRAQGKIRVIYTAHGFHFRKGAPPAQNAAFLPMEKLAGRWTDYLVVINREDEAAARRHRIVPSGRIRHMPGIGLNTGHYSSDAVSSEAVMRVRHELGLSPTDPLFLMIAEFTPNKRHCDAIRAFAQLECSRAHLALAGEGEQMEPVRQLVAELGIAGRIHFLGYRKDIPALTRASVATLLVSGREGLPRSVMESLCLETPVIGTRIRGINDLVTGECGWLIDVGDVAALARAMAEVIENPDEAQARGRRGRSTMAAYDLQNILALHDSLYAEALGASAPHQTQTPLSRTFSSAPSDAVRRLLSEPRR